MKKCESCNKIYEGDKEFCDFCGNKLIEDKEIIHDNSMTNNPIKTTEYYQY